MVPAEYVRMAYRLLLEREPENERVVADLSRLESLSELRTAFLTSEEYTGRPAARPAEHDLSASGPMTIETDASQAELEAMIAHIEADWNQLGASASGSCESVMRFHFTAIAPGMKTGVRSW